MYPPANALIASRDSNFIFGSVGSGAAGLRINGVLVPVWPDGAFMGWLPVPPPGSQWYDLVAYTAGDTVRRRYPVRTPAALPPRSVELTEAIAVSPAANAILTADPPSRLASDTDVAVIGRPTPTGTYRWFLFPGTSVQVTEYRGDMARVKLDANQEIWVSRSNIAASAHAGASFDRITLSDPHLLSASGEISLRVRSSAPPAYLVEEGERSLTLTLYNTRMPADPLAPEADPLVTAATQLHDGERTVYHFELTRPVYGYLALYHDGVFTLSIRRPPVVDVRNPLRGLTIVVDPGHPPIGATGPTGLWEPVATLAVGLRLRDILTQRGARVVMTRTSADPVGLYDRPIMARRANANVLVSIHLNADADGNNPFRTNGTGTYYFQPHSKPLATALQRALVPELGLRDRGVFFQNIALGRPTWFPSALTEGLYIIMPDQEAAIRTAEYQEAYATGIANGLEHFFTSLAP